MILSYLLMMQTYFSHIMTHTINAEVLGLCDWFKANKLSLKNLMLRNQTTSSSKQDKEEKNLI